ncbi:hypothetical protein [Microbispora sp. ATCC PTA-5024]|uniref:hypothetical protein n=1 Tax=Microbispora sp. ATCC PTA-5024 TaxID=316330 RepID=UPI0003DD8D85|nr:hypothetical protein [Microbispora sp. ATCC PTA-5024]ETK38120.1 hypothetical protein MPTA5024_00480 [Microbispora sp. ATCC PTA-5024]
MDGRRRAERGRRRYAGPRLIGFLTAVVGLAGAVAALGGVAYAVNGATQAGATVTVPVTINATADDGPPVRVPGATLPRSARLEPPGGALDLVAWDSTVAEQLLSRGDAAIAGLCLGAAAALLRPLLLSVRAGTPFRRGNAARVAGLGGLLVVGAAAGPALPHVAAALVVDRLRLEAALVTPWQIPLWPVLVGLLLLVAAEAVRRGAEQAGNVPGNVSGTA